jgi:hypothetical protein
MLLYFDDNTAHHALHLAPHENKMPETYPFGR